MNFVEKRCHVFLCRLKFNLFAHKVEMLNADAPIEHFHVSAQFLLEHGHHDTDSIMRGKAAVAFHNGNFKELYSIMEGRWVGNTIFANTFNTLHIMLAKTCFMFWFEMMSGKSVIRILQVI